MQPRAMAVQTQKDWRPGISWKVRKFNIVQDTSRSYRHSPDTEGEDVSEAGHRHTDPRVSQGLPHLLSDTQYFGFTSCLVNDVVVRLNYHEHVVNPDTQADEGQDGVHGSVGEAQDGADPHTDDHAHGNTEEAGDGEIKSDMDEVGVAEHEDCVDEHDEVSASHEESIEENGLSTDLTETLGGVGKDGGGLGGTVESQLYELLLPGEGPLVRQLQLQPTALAVVNLRVLRDLQPPDGADGEARSGVLP